MFDPPPSNPIAVPDPKPPLTVAQFEELKNRIKISQAYLDKPCLLVMNCQIEELWSIILCAEFGVEEQQRKEEEQKDRLSESKA